MNWLDIVVLLLWALIIAWGFWLGLLRILIPLAAVVLALVVASRGPTPLQIYSRRSPTMTMFRMSWPSSLYFWGYSLSAR